MFIIRFIVLFTTGLYLTWHIYIAFERHVFYSLSNVPDSKRVSKGLLKVIL